MSQRMAEAVEYSNVSPTYNNDKIEKRNSPEYSNYEDLDGFHKDRAEPHEYSRPVAREQRDPQGHGRPGSQSSPAPAQSNQVAQFQVESPSDNTRSYLWTLECTPLTVAMTVAIVLGLLAATGVITWHVTRITTPHRNGATYDSSSFPCLNGGSFQQSKAGFFCQCLPGYTGAKCETALSPVIYFLELAHEGPGGFITKLTSDGVQRLTSSNATHERALTMDLQSGLLFYSVYGQPRALWRAELDDITGTQAIIWKPSIEIVGLDLSAKDKVIFADDRSSVVMLHYNGSLINRLKLTKNGYACGLAVDEVQRVLYFTEKDSDSLWKVPFSPASFIGSATVILQGNQMGQAGNGPMGIVLDGGSLYWILGQTGEIRSMPVIGSTSTIVVPAANSSGYSSWYLAKKGDYFYYTRYVRDGGVYRVAAGGTREKLTTDTSFTMGIVMY